MGTEKNKLKDIEENYNECHSVENDLLSEMEQDDRFYLNDQKNDADIAYMKKYGIPDITINKVSKPANLLYGYYSQNQPDLKFFPIEGLDQEGADIYTQLAKWTMSQAISSYSKLTAFGDSSRVGLGWLNIEMDYTNDPIYGDPVVNFEDKYHIMWDPGARNPDFNEDCTYILRYAWPSKAKAISLYPDAENDIRKLKTGNASTYFTIQQPQNGIADRGARINIIEKWHKVWEKKTVLIDPITFESYEWNGGPRKLKQLQDQRPELMNSVEVVKLRAPRVKLMTSIEDKILVYDDYAPDGFSPTMYPLIPVFGYYVPNFNEWKLKVFGIIRQMRPAQREYNKMRSLMMEAAMSVPHSGYWYETGAVEKPSDLKKRGPAQNIEVRPGKKIEKIEGPTISQALATLHQMHHDDLTEIGPNPDVLGMIAGGSAADVSGVTYNLRKNQGMMTLQNLFDGIGLAHRTAGRYLVHLFNKWPKEKIERITGEPIPQDWEKRKNTSRFDCVIDEISSSPTVRMANFADMQSLVQHGMPIPTEVMRELSNLPAKTKKFWAEVDQNNLQSALKSREEEKQLRMMEIQTKVKNDVVVEKVKIEGDKEITQMKIESQEEMQERELMQRLVVEKIQENIVNKQMRMNEREY